ncbi:MAG: putative ATP-nad kinase [Chloroflexota bacterium]|jgi:NAD+ kinase
MPRFGFVYNPTNDLAQETWDEAAGWCATHGVESWGLPAEDQAAVKAKLPGTDLLISMGGDGTFLRAAAAVAGSAVPLLGINLGKVGFLARAEAFQLDQTLSALVAGTWKPQPRMALRAVIERLGGGREELIALNDVVIARGRLPRVLRLDVAIGESHLATYIADGVVLSSPTGSTGYSFSAGGPVLDPSSRNIIVTPIAAYLATLRSVVVAPSQGVTCTLVQGDDAVVSVDGWVDQVIGVGDRVTVTESPEPVQFIELPGLAPFWDLVRQKVELLPR